MRSAAVLLVVLLAGACSHGGGTEARRVDVAPTTSSSTTTSTSSTSTTTTATTTTAPPRPSTTTMTAARPRTATTTTAPLPRSGPRLVFMGQRDPAGTFDVWRADLDGTHRQVVARDVPTFASNYGRAADLAPDGTRLAYADTRDGQIHVRRLRDGADAAITSSPGVNDDPEWLDDGRIVFDHRAGENDSTDSWSGVASADGGGTRRLDVMVLCATYDHRLVVDEQPPTHVVSPDGTGETTVDPSAAMRLCGELAPDGQHVAWTEVAGPQSPYSRVVVARTDGADRHAFDPTQPTYFGAHSPAWSPDGTAVFFHDGGDQPEPGAIDRAGAAGSTVTKVLSFDTQGPWYFLGVRTAE